MWTPDLAERSSPRYVGVADALAEDIAQGRLEAGDRLPTHRELAKRLGVTVGTVSRAYAEAERRGLVRGEVGRGTFVRGVAVSPPMTFGEPLQDGGEMIDLGPSIPASPLHDEEERVLREGFAALAGSVALASLLECQPHAGMWHHRESAAVWLAELGLDVGPERILVTSGAQHAMAVTFATLTRPGDLVLVEQVTFPGMKGLASLLHLRLQGVAMDVDGLDPGAFERACRESDAKVLYTIPTLQNPTATLMPAARRLEITEIARRHGVSIVEDDVYGFLAEDRPPSFAALAPESAYSIHSVSKLTAPGLRAGFVVAPEAMVERIGASIWATTWMPSPPMAEIVSRWIGNGTLHRFAEWRRGEASARNELARRILAGVEFSGHPQGFFLWVRMPEPWCANDFVLQARQRGVLVSAPETFVAGRGAVPHAVRVSLAAVRERARLEAGLQIVGGLLAEAPEPRVSIA